ncbi:DNA gyrase subunit A [compost metagenome]
MGAVSIDESKELLLISDGGTLVRTRAAEVAMTGRNAQGVRLIRLSEEETLVGVVSIEAVEDEEEFLEGEVDTSELDTEDAVSTNDDASEE